MAAIEAAGMDPGPDPEVAAVRAALERLGQLVAARSGATLAEFSDRQPVLLVGSEPGEIARGREELARFFARVFERPETFTWDWATVDVTVAGPVAWLYAEGHVVVRKQGGEVRAPYRLTAVFEREDGRWRWRHFHGAEPA